MDCNNCICVACAKNATCTACDTCDIDQHIVISNCKDYKQMLSVQSEEPETSKDKSNIEITYSWGESEPIIKCKSHKKAWKKLKKMAINELETASIEHDCNCYITFDSLANELILNYVYDNETATYKLV